MFKINNKNTRTTPVACSSVSIVSFKQVNVGWYVFWGTCNWNSNIFVELKEWFRSDKFGFAEILHCFHIIKKHPLGFIIFSLSQYYPYYRNG